MWERMQYSTLLEKGLEQRAGGSALVVDTNGEDIGADSVQSPGTPGGFSDCEGEEAVEKEEQEIVAKTREKSRAANKIKKKPPRRR